MAAIGATLHQPSVTRGREQVARLPFAWPLYALFVGFPLWWALGLGPFIWLIMAVPVTFSLIARTRVRIPKGFGLYVLFFMWMMATFVQLNGPDRAIGFLFRACLYFSAAALGLWVYNAPKRLVPTQTAVRIMAFFWIVVVAGGLFGMISPHFEFTSLVEHFLPKRLLANDFVYSLVHPAAAQVQTFLGYPVPRPTAPFTFTNDWGANFALLVPFVLAAWSQTRSVLRRNILRTIAVVSLFPVIFSLNRVLWFCLVVCMVYGAVRFALRGRVGAIQGVVALGVVAVAMFTFGPTAKLINDRVNTPHSNQGREILYNEAADSVGRSPLLGYGAPRPSQVNPNLPSVGTQGQFWLVLFSHGIPGAMLFVSFLGYAAWRTRKAPTSATLWCHVTVLLGIVMMPFYGLFEAQIHIIFVALALALRETVEPDPIEPTLIARVEPAPELVAAVAAEPRTNGRALPPVEGNGAHPNGNGHSPWGEPSGDHGNWE
jgi:polysaccharide biosynthesis protein PslJ